MIALQDCFEDSSIRELVFDEVITEETMLCLSRLGHLDYYADFPRPFFRITRNREYHFRGVLGGKSIKVVFERPLSDKEMATFTDQVAEVLAGPSPSGPEE